MRIRHACLFLALAAVIPILGPSNGFTQGKGGRDPGGKRGWDPAAMFDRFSEGRDFIDFTNPTQSMSRMGRFLDSYISAAKEVGMNPSRIDRNQFVTLQENVMQAFRNGGGRGPNRGGPSQGGPSSGPGANRDSYDEERAKASFQRMDKNGDGVITPSEASDTLKAEFEKWDTNKNGVIEFDEYKEYYKARMAYLRGDRDDRSRDGDAYQRAIQDAQEAEMPRPTVYHAGNLPQELTQVAPWFSQLDRDKDGQIGLYEWKAAGYSADEFVKWDANGDGFITVEEALRHIRAMKMVAKTDTTTPTDGSTDTTTGSTGPQTGPVIRGANRGPGPGPNGNRMQPRDPNGRQRPGPGPGPGTPGPNGRDRGQRQPRTP